MEAITRTRIKLNLFQNRDGTSLLSQNYFTRSVERSPMTRRTCDHDVMTEENFK